MCEWKSVEEDGMPKENGCFLIKHTKYYCYPVMACYLFAEGEFILQHGGAMPATFPTSIPIVATHWLRIPD